MIYFVAAMEIDRVKIGHTAGEDAGPRIAALQTGCPCDLTLVACLPGGLRVERELHRQFAAQRFRGEWFRLSGPVREFLDATAPAIVGSAVPSLTYGLLAFWEPRLLHVERTVRIAARSAEGSERACANELWFETPDLDTAFTETVGWYRQRRHRLEELDAVLRSVEAHDVAFEHLYGLLPDCRGCEC